MKQGKNAEIYRSGAIFLGKDQENKKYKKRALSHQNYHGKTVCYLRSKAPDVLLCPQPKGEKAVVYYLLLKQQISSVNLPASTLKHTDQCNCSPPY
jgi:hypothetical protein